MQITEEISPCKGCKLEKNDKEECMANCKRLQAYQEGHAYQHLPHYDKVPQIVNKAQEIPKTISPARLETSWKKAMPKEADQYEQLKKLISEGGQCLLCKNQSERMGLCMICWQRWYHAREKHPVVGKYRKMTREERILARHGNPVECLIEGCKRVGNKRGLCDKHYKLWRDKKILHPEFGVWFAKGKKKEVAMKNKVEYKINLTTEDEITPAMMDRAVDEKVTPEEGQEKVILHSVLLDFTNYSGIYQELKEQMRLTKLPLGHTIFNLLSLGIMTAHDESERRNKNDKKD